MKASHWTCIEHPLNTYWTVIEQALNAHWTWRPGIEHALNMKASHWTRIEHEGQALNLHWTPIEHALNSQWTGIERTLNIEHWRRFDHLTLTTLYSHKGLNTSSNMQVYIKALSYKVFAPMWPATSTTYCSQCGPRRVLAWGYRLQAWSRDFCCSCPMRWLALMGQLPPIGAW